jgi:predicted TIM-barrel fold metal-dependent hydrolase
MSKRREFLKSLAGVTTGIFFVACDFWAATPSLQGAGTDKRREIMVGGQRALTVDIHSHCYVDVSDLVKEHQANTISSAAQSAPRTPFLNPTDVDGRLRHMDEHGIDVQAVCIAPNYNSWADRDLAARIAQRQNEEIAQMCSAHPERFVGLGAVALQHPDLAAEQMDHAVKKLGMRGFEIDASVNGEPLSAPRFDPFWAKAEQLGVLFFIHPESAVGAKPQFPGNGFLDNVIGHPLQTTVALSHLIFEGTLDRYPGLKICGAHGGGYLGSYLGRSDHCAEFGDECKPVEKKHPSEYFKQQLYCDSVVFTAEGLRHLVANVGASHVLLGTDFPYDVGFPHMGEALEADSILDAVGLSNAEQLAILGGNAAKLLRINS